MKENEPTLQITKGPTMKPLATLLAIITLAIPSHAASPRACRLAAPSRVNRVHAVSTAHNKPQFVVTAFAVPVAVPVAPFAPYWYGVSDYREPLVPKLRLGTHHPEAPLREPQAEPSTAQIGRHSSQTARSLVTQRCTSCHGRTSPKQGLSLVDPLSLSDHNRLRAIRAVISGEMPPETEPPLADADRNALLRELLNDTPTTDNENDQ
jgi:hypothetical protein